MTINLPVSGSVQVAVNHIFDRATLQAIADLTAQLKALTAVLADEAVTPDELARLRDIAAKIEAQSQPKGT